MKTGASKPDISTPEAFKRAFWLPRESAIPTRLPAAPAAFIRQAARQDGHRRPTERLRQSIRLRRLFGDAAHERRRRLAIQRNPSFCRSPASRWSDLCPATTTFTSSMQPASTGCGASRSRESTDQILEVRRRRSGVQGEGTQTGGCAERNIAGDQVTYCAKPWPNDQFSLSTSRRLMNTSCGRTPGCSASSSTIRAKSAFF